MNQRKLFGFLLISFMLAGIATPFIFVQPVQATGYAQINPSFDFNLIAPGTANILRQQWALLVTNNMKDLGINAIRHLLSWGTTYARALEPDPSVLGLTYAQGGFDSLFIGYAMSVDPNPYALYHSSQLAPAGQNYVLWEDAYNDALTLNITRELNVTKQLLLVKQWQQYEYEQAVDISLFYTKEVVGMRTNVNSTPFQKNHYPLWPGVEHWSYTSSPSSSITIAETGELLEVSPFHSTSYYDLTAYGPIYGEFGGYGLYRRNASFLMEPYMAYSNTTHTSNGLNWTVWIRPGIKFQNGEDLDGRDYVYSLRYAGFIPQWGCPIRSYLASILGTNNSFGWAGEAGTPWAALPTNYYEVHFTLPNTWAFFVPDILGTTILPASVIVNSSGGIPDFASWTPLAYYNVSRWALTSFNSLTAAAGSGTPYNYYAKNLTLYSHNGPIGAGPYQFVSYSTLTETIHLTKFPNYFDTSRLVAQGEYGITDYYVTIITEVTPAIAALHANTVQVLDSQYHLEQALSQLDPSWSKYIYYDAYGVQCLGFNMRHPIVGTGLGTPNGIANSSNAAEAARHVRRAIEYLAPKAGIISSMLNGFGSYGITVPITRVTSGFDTSIVPRAPATQVDAYTAAILEFEAAGYTFTYPAAPSFWDAYGLIISVAELAVIVVLAGFYFFRPRKL